MLFFLASRNPSFPSRNPLRKEEGKGLFQAPPHWAYFFASGTKPTSFTAFWPLAGSRMYFMSAPEAPEGLPLVNTYSSRLRGHSLESAVSAEAATLPMCRPLMLGAR